MHQMLQKEIYCVVHYFKNIDIPETLFGDYKLLIFFRTLVF